MKICPTCKTEYAGGEVFCPVDASRLVTPSQIPGPEERSPNDPLVGTLLAGRYKVLRRIGEGGMGLVYEGLHAVIEKRVAIKVLRDDFSSRPDVVERFRQEAKSASRIGHENIVDISDFGETPSGASYFVMEFLEGEDLANVLAREHVLAPERAIHILEQCCRALGAAHSKGIVHRDMKPENIFLTRRGSDPDFVKIVDFGIAKMSDIETAGAPGRKLTKTGMIFGTPEYMSPEQAAGKSLDHRVDIYALGVILYELLTGRVPFVGDSFMGILTQHMFEEVPKLRETNPDVQVSVPLEAVVWKALAKNPDERYQTMDELAAALDDAKHGRVAEPTLHGYGDPIKAKAAPRPAAPKLDVARAEARTAEAPSGSRSGLLVAVGLVSLVLAGVGVYFGTRTTPVPVDAGAAVVVDAAPAAVVDAATAAGPAATPDAATTVDAGPTLVDVRVETRPDGADVVVEGTETRCSPTPCSVRIESGRAAVLHAERGRSVGSLEVTPTTAMTVQIALAARASGRPSGSGGGGGGTGSGRGSDLKIPDLFR
ncbi:MAG: serine/threonine-protein kinase [Polyangiales bacterium]